MNKKKRIGLLTIVIFIAGLIMTVIGAVVTVTYGVILAEPSTRALLFSALLFCRSGWLENRLGKAVVGGQIRPEALLRDSNNHSILRLIFGFLSFMNLNFSSFLANSRALKNILSNGRGQATNEKASEH